MLAISVNPIDWVTSAAGDVASAASTGFFNAFGSWLDDGLQWVARQVATLMVDLSTPKVGSAAFVQLAGWFKWLALATTVATIIASAGGALIVSRVEISDVAREIPKTLLLLAGWYAAVGIWFELTRTLTVAFTGPALTGALSAGMSLDASIVGSPRMLVVLFMQLFLLVFLLEMIMLQHLLAMATIIGPLSIGLRPWPPLRDVFGRVVRNLAMLSLTPALAAGSMSLAVGNLAPGAALGFTQALGALAGMAVSVLMPYLVHRFLPLGGSSDTGGRALIAAGAATAGAAATVVTGGAAAPVAMAGSRLASMSQGSGDDD